MASYIFILCPPYSGSTVLWHLIGTSDAVSLLPSEGQFLPDVRDAMRRNPWSEDTEMPWLDIKAAWHKYWDSAKPLWVEKSPPNLVRAHAIAEHFAPAVFLVMVRDPYAHCEGLMRRNGWTATRAAEFSLRCLTWQKKNAESLGSSLSFTYEDLVDAPERVCARLEALVPDLGQLDYRREFSVHSLDGNVPRVLENLNQRKLERLSATDTEQIGAVLCTRTDVIEHWGYTLRAVGPEGDRSGRSKHAGP